MLATISPSALSGTLAAPPSKSVAHRAVLCAALASGVSSLSGLEYSKDISATLGAAGQLCAKVTTQGDRATIQGLGGFRTVVAPVDCCESGSTLRFLIPVASLSGQKVTFTGRGRLFARPMEVYRKLFEEKRLHFTQQADSITISGGALPAGEYTVAGNVSSQFISGLLFTLPLCSGDSVLHILPPFESRSYVELTLAVLADYGVTAQWQDEYTLQIPGGQQYRANSLRMEGDYSNAAFPAVYGALRGGVTVTNLRQDSAQGDAVLLDLLKIAGANFTRQKDAVSFSAAPLHGTYIDLADCPDLGPILMVMGLFAQGTTILDNAGRLRLKESDRIAAMEQEIRAMGGQIFSSENTVTVSHSVLHAPAAPLNGHNDHRVVMSMTVAALAAGVPIRITEAEAVEKSWPGFWDAIKALGAEVTLDA